MHKFDQLHKIDHLYRCYFHYKNQKRRLTDYEAIKHYACINIMINEIGAMVGSLVTEARAKDAALKAAAAAKTAAEKGAK